LDWVYLCIITFAAAVIQSSTGFGFGLIAVPVFLLILDSVAAIQMVMIIILFMAIVDGWKLKGQSSRFILLWLIIGMLAGFPFGLYLFYKMELAVLKTLVACVIMLFSMINLFRLYRGHQAHKNPVKEGGRGLIMVTGYFSGLMTTSLAMPGPAVMLLLLHKGLDKNLIRATILTFFIFAYAGSIVLQTLLIGVSSTTWTTSFILLPFGLVGVMLGHYLAHKIDQKLFKLIVLVILILTALVMLYQLF